MGFIWRDRDGYEVGDRVRLIHAEYKLPVGTEMTISEVEAHGHLWSEDSGSPEYRRICLDPSWIELI